MYCYNEHSPAECRKRCETEWGLQGAPMPDSVDWKSVCEAKPLGRNLLKNPLLHCNTLQLQIFRLVSLEIKHLHESIYQLHVKLLGTDKSTVISEHTVNPSEELSTYSHKWKEFTGSS
ncbi:F-box only protein 50-like [Odontesthes bonariensis]